MPVFKWLVRLVGSLGVLTRLAVVIFMFAPAITVAVLSFTNDSVLIFPPRSWGFGLYRSFFSSSAWTGAVLTSFEIAFPAALIALAIGVPAAYAFSRTGLPFRGALRLAGLIPLMLPGVAYAVAIYTFYAQLHLLYTTIGVIMVHATLGIPFVLLIVGAGFGSISPEYELVAMTLGANRRRAVISTTLRLALPSMVAAYVFAFLASFDEGVIVQFVAGPGQTTLPKAIYDSVRTGLDPRILAIATILMVLTGVLIAGAQYFRRPRAQA
jgi:ABC-type spermidine/putrescine transport system permease subunit II